MWRLSIAGTSAALLGVAAYLLSPTPAYACSGAPPFDPIATSDVIVEGRILGWEFAPDLIATVNFLAIRIDMTVERVWKGQVAGEVITLSDTASLHPPFPSSDNDEYEWVGGSGACGAFDADPVGFYAIMGLTQRDDGTYGTNRLRVFFWGDDAGGERYDLALQRMASYPGAAALPALGSGPSASVSRSTVKLTVAGIMAMMGTALLSLAVLSRISVRRST